MPNNVLQVAREVERMLKPQCKKIEITGSIRRGSTTPSDVDILCIPRERATINSMISGIGSVTKDGKSFMSAIIDGVQVDVWFTDEKHWGAMEFYTTGPSGYAIGWRVMAKKRGWILNQYGVYDRNTNELLASRTERDIYELFGHEYKPPERRGR